MHNNVAGIKVEVAPCYKKVGQLGYILFFLKKPILGHNNSLKHFIRSFIIYL